MADTTAGAFAMWRKALRGLETEDAQEAGRPGAKPRSARERHWTAYKAVLADLEWEGRLPGGVVGRLNRLRGTVAASALRRGGQAYVHICPRD